MEKKKSAPQPQPASNKELIKRSFALYAGSFSKVIIFAFMLSIVIFIPHLISDFTGQDLFFSLQLFSPQKLWLLLVDLIGLVIFIAIFWRIYCVYRKRHEPMIEDIFTGLKKVLYVMIAAFIQSTIFFILAMITYGLQVVLKKFHLLFQHNILAILLSSLLFFGQLFLMIYLSTMFIFILPLIAIENNHILYAIEHSASLVWNHWWRTFILQMIPWITYLTVLIIVRYTLNINVHIFFFSSLTLSPLATIFQIIIFALLIPWVAALLFVQLKDLELRKKIELSRAKK